MRIKITACLLCLGILMSVSVFAFSDVGVLSNDRTLGYFLLSSTELSRLSSSLVYKQKQNERWALEVTGLSYASPYLLTRNVTKIRFDEKYKVGDLGPLSLSALAGVALLYSPSVGGGVAGDFGAVVSASIIEGLAIALPLNFIIYSDGTEVDVSPGVSYKIPFLKDYELYAGGRAEAQAVGNFSSGGSGSSSGKVNLYVDFGLRTGL